MSFGRSVAWSVVMLALVGSGCDRNRHPETRPAAGPMTVRRLPATPEKTDSIEALLAFGLADAPGHLRVTLELEGTGDAPEPFVHDALFLLRGDGRLQVSFRPPWPDHPNGQVAIRVEGQGTESTVVYEPQLWFDRPGTTVAVTVPMPEGGASAAPGSDVRLAEVVATVPGAARPMSATFSVAAAPDPIKPRVKAGVRAPR